jgi:hypothetical protein
VTVSYPTTAPAKALTAGEQKNLKALIENDYRRARHALTQALVAQNRKIDEEAADLFPEALIDEANTAVAGAMELVRETWAHQWRSVQQAYPTLRVGTERMTSETDPVPYLSFSNVYVGYPGKERWVEEQQVMARKAFDEANAVLAAQELEAQRTVLVRGVGSQEALNVLLEIPAATDLFTNRVLELESAPAGTDG